jgi:hypothetical protein
VIGFDHHPKTRSFFTENGISDLCVPLDRPDMLGAALRRVESDYGTYVERIRLIRRNLLDTGRRDLDTCRLALSPVNLTKRRETPLQWLAGRFG